MNCILDGGCIRDSMSCDLACQATPRDIGERGLSDAVTKGRAVSELMTLDLDQVRSVARNAADCYRIVSELGGAKRLRVAAMNHCIEIMDACEKVTGEMDGRPDRL